MALTLEPTVRDLSPSSGFGALLKSWREARGLSQSALSGRANVSQRHLSFLEQGRSQPTRAMIVTLARALDIPLRDRNALFMAAGFTPSYRAEPLSSNAMAPIARAIDHALAAHEPLPGLLLDQHWNILRSNQGAVRLFAYYLGPDFADQVDPAKPLNMIEAMCGGAGLRRVISNWDEVARSVAERLRHECLGGVVDRRTAELIDLVAHALDMKSVAAEARAAPLPFVDLVLSDGRMTTRWFTAMMAFGSPVDVTLQETRIEFLYPVDEVTTAFAERLAVDG